jgi:hypothetical protein
MSLAEWIVVGICGVAGVGLLILAVYGKLGEMEEMMSTNERMKKRLGKEVVEKKDDLIGRK